MPCNSSDGMGDAYREDPVAQRKVATLEQRVTALESALCGLCQPFLDNHRLDLLHPQTRAWFEEHLKHPGCTAGKG